METIIDSWLMIVDDGARRRVISTIIGLTRAQDLLHADWKNLHYYCEACERYFSYILRSYKKNVRTI